MGKQMQIYINTYISACMYICTYIHMCIYPHNSIYINTCVKKEPEREREQICHNVFFKNASEGAYLDGVASTQSVRLDSGLVRWLISPHHLDRDGQYLPRTCCFFKTL
jgi:hypothetical protein